MGIWNSQVVVLGNKLCMGENRVINNNCYLRISDLMMHTWEQIKSPTIWSALAIYQERLVLVGGQDPFTRTPTNQLWVMEDEGTWTQPLPPMPTPRWGASVATIHNHLIVAGGMSIQEEYLDVVEVYNGQQWVTAQSLPRACCDMKSAILSGNWYLVGGRDQGREVFCASLESLVASTQSEVTEGVWKTLPEVHHESSSTAVWEGRLMAIGGGASESDVLSYSPHTQSWVKVGDLPVTLDSVCTIVLPTEELLVVGGYKLRTVRGRHSVFKGSLRGES